jgi:hypothetical protein
MRFSAAGLTLVLLLSGAGHAQESMQAGVPAESAAADAPVVEVSGVRNPALKPYRQMLKGVDAFEAHRALAPKAPPNFKLVSDNGAVAFDTVSLTISGDHTSVPVALAPDGSFTLVRDQAAADDNADLVSNKKKSQLGWHGDIHTPGVPDNARRLGDLRLECEISWAVTREDMSFLTRNGLGLLGGPCHTARIKLHYLAPKPLASATLVSGEGRLALTVDRKNPRVFQPVLADDGWNDDSLVVYEFSDTRNP